MENRMKVIIPYLISEYQHAFFPNRLMQDSSILAHELIT